MQNTRKIFGGTRMDYPPQLKVVFKIFKKSYTMCKNDQIRNIAKQT